MNNHLKFWLTLGSLFSFVCIFLFTIFMSIKEQIAFKKEYCLFLLPILIYNMGQFVINYCNLIEKENENK